MSTGGVIHFLVADPADVATPSADHIAYFANSLDGNKPYWKDDTGAIHSLLGPTGVTGSQGPMGIAEDPEDTLIIPGPQGQQGIPGLASTVPGPVGPPGMVEEYEPEIVLIPGPKGDQGSPGAASTVPGPMGPPGIAEDYEPEIFLIPGPKGDTGPAGTGGSGGGTSFRGARVYNNAAISIANNTATALTFNTERFDTDAFHDTGSNTSRLTIPAGMGGKYLIGGNVEWPSNATSARLLYIQVNGTTPIASTAFQAVSGSLTHNNVSCIYDLAAGDYVELIAYQLSGGSLNVNSAANYSPEFWISKLNGGGGIVQVQNTQTGASSTTTTILPGNDDTIPQNSEGGEFMTLAITPTSATNKLRIDVVVNGAVSTQAWACAALFQDSGADALAAINFFASANGGGSSSAILTFTHYMTAGTTSATTFKVRAGMSVSGTFTFNGASGARLLGGVMASSITITEIVP